MNIGEMIRSKRKALQMTQKDLALALNITAPAVNKWERGFSYPDITLLPQLARLLKTDINALLLFQEKLAEKEIQEFLSMLINVDKEEAVQRCKDKINEFPNDDMLKLNVAMILIGRFRVDDDFVDCLLLACSSSHEDKIKYKGTSLLVNKLLVKNAFSEALEYIESLPEHYNQKEQLTCVAYLAMDDVDKGEIKVQNKLLNDATTLSNTLIMSLELMLKANRVKDAAKTMAIIEQLHELMGLWTFNSISAKLSYCVSLKDESTVVDLLYQLLDTVKLSYRVSDCFLYNKLTDRGFDQKSFVQDSMDDYLSSIHDLLPDIVLREDYQSFIVSYKNHFKGSIYS